MSSPLTRLETALMLAATAAVLLAGFGPPVAQFAHYHDFADQRGACGWPHAMDVLSNLPFALGGFLGLRALVRHRAAGTAPCVQQPLAALFFAGLVLAAIGSGLYHWQPGDARLAYDRLGMVAAFAGLLGLAVAERVSARAGLWLAAGVLLWGPLSVMVWAGVGNLLPWAVLQGGGMLLLLGLACCRPVGGAWGLSVMGVIAVYALAKLLELGDHAVFAWTGGLVSGHSLKHLAAASSAWPVIAAVRRTRPFVHNVGRAWGPAGASVI